METRFEATATATATATKMKQEVLLGKYEIGRLLGRGTFAKVYHARSLSDDTVVAVKVLNKPEVVATGMAPRILREVDAMRRLSHHPNILRLHEVMATKTKIYLVVEYAPGGELLARIARRGRLPEPAARRYFQQLLSALRFCHARGIAHRDVKPQNLLLDRHGALKVSDFGLSALPEHLRNDGRLHTSCGTPAYAAPEVLRGKGGYDGAKADAWSCGVILFVLLAGSLPFDDANLALMYRRVHKRDYQFPPWFPPSARRIVARLLDPNPDTRLTLDALAELPWLKRSYSVDQKLSLLDVPPPSPRLNRTTSVPAVINAFDIISMSSGLDLSGLFAGRGLREKRFTSTATIDRILERIDEAAAKLGYSTDRGGAARAEKWGSSVLSVEVLELASPLLMVELKVEETGEEFCWAELKAELMDIVFAWQAKEEDSVVQNALNL